MIILNAKTKETTHFDENTEPISEKSLQSIIEQNLRSLFNLLLVASEFPVSGLNEKGRIDTLALDSQGRLVVLEYKRDGSNNCMSQGLGYINLIQQNSNMQSHIEQLVKKQINFNDIRLICVAQNFSNSDLYLHANIHVHTEVYSYRYTSCANLILSKQYGSTHVTTVQKNSEPFEHKDYLTDFLDKALNFYYVQKNKTLDSVNPYVTDKLMLVSQPSSDGPGKYGNRIKEEACIYGKRLLLIDVKNTVHLLEQKYRSVSFDLHSIYATIHASFEKSLKNPTYLDNMVLAPKQYKHHMYGMYTAFNLNKVLDIFPGYSQLIADL